MGRLKCDICGGEDFIKVGDDLFKCEGCGCKYTAEEARRMLTGKGAASVQRSNAQSPSNSGQDFTIIGGKLVRYKGAGTKVVIPDTVTIIGRDAFRDCSGVTDIVIPDSVTAIEKCAFINCSSIKSIVIPDSVRVLGSRDPEEISLDVFFKCTSLENVQLSRNIDIIGKGIFWGCSALREIVIPEGIRIIDVKAFEGCRALEKITLPQSLQEWRGGSYRLSRSLASVEGNSEVFFRGCVHEDHLLQYKDLPTYNSERDPIVIVDYANRIRAQRRAQHRCENCGGKFQGVFEKRCSQCNMQKSY